MIFQKVTMTFFTHTSYNKKKKTQKTLSQILLICFNRSLLVQLSSSFSIISDLNNSVTLWFLCMSAYMGICEYLHTSSLKRSIPSSHDSQLHSREVQVVRLFTSDLGEHSFQSIALVWHMLVWSTHYTTARACYASDACLYKNLCMTQCA